MGDPENRGGGDAAELTRLREENARLRGDQDRAAEERALRGPAQPDTDAARQARAEAEGRQEQERKRFSGDEGLRELARLTQLHGPGSEQAQADFDRLRIGLGDEEHEAHVLLRELRRAEADFRGIGGSPLGSAQLAREIEDARKAVEANPIAKERLQRIERARRRGEPVDFTTEEG